MSNAKYKGVKYLDGKYEVVAVPSDLSGITHDYFKTLEDARNFVKKTIKREDPEAGVKILEAVEVNGDKSYEKEVE